MFKISVETELKPNTAKIIGEYLCDQFFINGTRDFKPNVVRLLSEIEEEYTYFCGRLKINDSYVECYVENNIGSVIFVIDSPDEEFTWSLSVNPTFALGKWFLMKNGGN